MIEENNEKQAEQIEKEEKSDAILTAPVQNQKEKLRDVQKSLAETDKQRLPELLTDGEREKRAKEAKAKLLKNRERAERAAIERAAFDAEKGEYRQRLEARESKRATEQKRAREEAERLEKERLDEIHEREVREFVRKEREAGAEIGAKTDALLAAINAAFDSGRSEMQITERELDAKRYNRPKHNVSERVDDPDDLSITIGGEPDEDMTIFVGYDSSPLDEEEVDQDMILTIGDAEDIPAPVEHFAPDSSYMADSYQEAVEKTRGDIPSERDGSDDGLVERKRESDIRAAESRHMALRAAAIVQASGVYNEELRLLREEEDRYKAELESIRRKRYEYSELIAEMRSEAYSYESREIIANERPRARKTDEGSRDLYEKYGASLGLDSAERDRRIVSEYDKHREKIEQRDFVERRIEKDAQDVGGVTTRTPELHEEYPLYNESHHGGDKTIYMGADDSYPYVFDTETERKLISEYERSLNNKNAQETIPAAPVKTVKSERAEEEDHSEYEEHREFSYHGETLDLFAKSRLSKRLNKFYKDEYSLKKKKARLATDQKKASPEENVSIIVKKIAIEKELCEMAADALGACVYVGVKARTGKHKKILEFHIDEYNDLCDEYETATGRSLQRLDYEIVDEVLEGKLFRPIQNVYYHGMEEDTYRSSLTEETELENRLRAELGYVSEEFEKHLSGDGVIEYTESERRTMQQRRSERMSAVKRAAERDVLLVTLRTENRVSELEARRDVIMNSFGTNKRDKTREIREIDKRIDRIKREERRAAKLEREDNSRYYFLAALDSANEKVKKGARRERLEALRLRLDVLLSERESINERLIALYGGSDRRLSVAKISRKAGSVRRKAAKNMYKRQSELASKIDRFKAPLDMKERAYEMLNKRIAYAAEYEECRYKLRKMNGGGRANAELIRRMKAAKNSLASSEREIKYMIKKLKKQEERYRSEREWAGMMIFLGVMTVACVFAWSLFGDDILNYFNKWIEYFKK